MAIDEQEYEEIKEIQIIDAENSILNRSNLTMEDNNKASKPEKSKIT